MNLEILEDYRQKYLKKLKICWGVAFLVGLVAVLIVIIYLSATSTVSWSWEYLIMGFTPLIFILTFAALIIAWITRRDYLNYQQVYKLYFVERNLRQVFDHVNYSHTAGIERKVLDFTGMMKTGDRYHSNDLIVGQYKNVKLAQADVKIETETRDSDGNPQYTTIFQGRWMIFEFPKKFDFRLQVVARKFGANLVPKKLKRIETESVDFNKKFKVYAEDGFEAFYILNPARMAQIEELADEFKHKMILCFIDNKMHVGINDGNDAFEPPSVWKKLDYEKEDAKILHEIHLITQFIDKMRLENGK